MMVYRHAQAYLKAVFNNKNSQRLYWQLFMNLRDRYRISFASISDIPNDSKKSWWASGDRDSNSACHFIMAGSSMPAA